MAAPYKRAKLEPQLTLSHSELMQCSGEEKAQQALRASFLLRLNSIQSCESEATVENESLEIPLKRKREEPAAKDPEIALKCTESEKESDEISAPAFVPTGTLLINAYGALFYSLQTYTHSSAFYLLLRSGPCGSPGLKAIKGPFHSLARLDQEIACLCQAKVEAGYVDTRFRGWWKGPVRTRSEHRKGEALGRLLGSERLRGLALREVGFARKKKQFEQLGLEDIEKGYGILRQIEAAIRENQQEEIRRLTKRFYAVIPHKQAYDQDGDTQIDHLGKLRTQTALLNTLNALKRTPSPANIAPKLAPLDHGSQLYADLKSAFTSTHSHPLMYSAEVEAIFEIGSETAVDEEMQGLWYGAKTCSWGSVLDSGVHTCASAPQSVFESGAGAYLFDVAGRAAAACCPTRNNTIGFVALCAVPRPETSQLPSQRSPGRFQPSHCSLIEGVQVPWGPLCPSNSPASALLFNQYVFTAAAQVHLKYLFQIRFRFP